MPCPSRNRPERAIRRVLIRDLFDFRLDDKPGNMAKIGLVKLVNFRPEFGAYWPFFNMARSDRLTYELGAKGSHLRIGRLKVA